MSASFVETLRTETVEARARREEEDAAKKEATAAKRAANKAARGGKTKKQVAFENFIKEQAPVLIEKLTNEAKEEAQKGNPSLYWGVSRTWQGYKHKEPADVTTELERTTALRDKVAEHFTKLHFDVAPIDELVHHESVRYDPEDPWLPAWTERTVGLEIAWAEPQPTE